MAIEGWGVGGWGTGIWGSIVFTNAPNLIDVSPGVLEVEGGTVVTIIGLDFFPEFVPQVLSGPAGGPYVIVAEGFLFDPNFDLTPTKAIAGMPALPAGTYHLRVQTPAGLSDVLVDALVYKPHADEVRIQKGRSSWSQKWATGFRLGA